MRMSKLEINPRWRLKMIQANRDINAQSGSQNKMSIDNRHEKKNWQDNWFLYLVIGIAIIVIAAIILNYFHIPSN